MAAPSQSDLRTTLEDELASGSYAGLSTALLEAVARVVHEHAAQYVDPADPPVGRRGTPGQYTSVGLGYASDTARASGFVVNFDPTSTTTGIQAGGFTAGVEATSNGTVEVASTAGFSAGDVVQVSGSISNDGFYEVMDVLAGPARIRIKGVGTTTTVESWSSTNFTAEVGAGSVTKVSLAVLRVSSSGTWEISAGSTTPFTYVTLMKDDDPRNTDARDPTTHGADHRPTGSDPIDPAGVVDPASPYTVAAGVRRIMSESSLTINLPDSGIAIGEVVTVSNTSTGSIDVTFARSGSDTVDAGTSVVVTVGAHGVVGAQRRASGDWRSLQPGSIHVNTPRAVYITVVAGVLGWTEQVWSGSGWIDVSIFTALTTEIDGGVTFSGTDLVLPIGLSVSTAPASDPDQRYVAISDTSATFQSMFEEGAQWIVTAEESGMTQTVNARCGWLLAFPTGDFDSGAENNIASRMGWNGTAWALNNASTNASYGTTSTAASLGRRKFSAAVATATSGSWMWKIAPDDGTFTPSNTAPTRLYISCSATVADTLASTTVSGIGVRLAVFPLAM